MMLWAVFSSHSLSLKYFFRRILHLKILRNLCQEMQTLKPIHQSAKPNRSKRDQTELKTSQHCPKKEKKKKNQKNLTPFPSSIVMISALPSACRACSARSSIHSSNPWNSGKLSARHSVHDH